MPQPSHLALLGLLLLSACGGPPERQPNSLAHEQTRHAAIPLSFAPASPAPLPQDWPTLEALQHDLGPGARVILVAEGPLAASRRQTLASILQHDVGLAPPMRANALTANTATLQIDETRQVADACMGPGVAVGQNLWPGDDATRQRLLPAGCATSEALLRQMENPEDVLHGRALAPGAAGPFVQAIQRYYERNDADMVNPPSRRGVNGQGYQGDQELGTPMTPSATPPIDSSVGQDMTAPVPRSSPHQTQGSP